MRAMELVFILIPIFLFVLIRSAMEQRAQARSERTKLLEEALRNPAIDRPTLTSLAHQLTGVKPPATNGAGASSGGGLQALLLALGWLTLLDAKRQFAVATDAENAARVAHQKALDEIARRERLESQLRQSQ